MLFLFAQFYVQSYLGKKSAKAEAKDKKR